VILNLQRYDGIFIRVNGYAPENEKGQSVNGYAPESTDNKTTYFPNVNGHAPEKGYFLSTENRVNGFAPEMVPLNGYAPEFGMFCFSL
jgi:hypothetical protein